MKAFNTKIIAISKNHPKTSVLQAISHGVREFGENRVQEALAKFDDLKKEYPDIKLHFQNSSWRETHEYVFEMESIQVFPGKCMTDVKKNEK